MDMKQLQTFITLCQTLNYPKAAEQLQYAPSTLFKHVQLLEQELGVPLFAKNGRQLALTADGEAFIRHAQRILEEYRQALGSIAGDGQREETITVGGCEINTAFDLMGLFEQFNRKRPTVRMRMMLTPNASVPAMVRGGMADIGFFYTVRGYEQTGLQSVPLYPERVYLMASCENPLAARRGLRYRDLEGAHFFYPHDTCCFVEELFACLSRADVALGCSRYLGNMQLVIERVRQGGAVTLVPQGAAERIEHGYGLVRLDMEEEPICAWETIVYKGDSVLGPAARDLLRHSLGYARRIAPEQAPSGSLRIFE